MIYMIEKFTGQDTFTVPITIRIKHRFLLVDSFKSMNSKYIKSCTRQSEREHKNKLRKKTMTHPSATKLKEGGGPVLNSISIILIQSIHLLFECTEEVGLLGLKGGWSASENLSISLFPNLPSSN
jgi:hypothetical protein